VSKGKVAEREVARMLQAWWQRCDPAAQFVRTPQSGGWSTPDVRRGFRMSGDVMTTSETFPFTVESKRREAWSPRNFVLGRPCPVWGWWRQAGGQAVELGAEPMLWMRRNADPPERFGEPRKIPPWIVLVRAGLVEQLGLPFPDFVWGTDDLAGVDVAEVVPSGYTHDRLLAVDPVTFLGVEGRLWQSSETFRRRWMERERLRKAAG